MKTLYQYFEVVYSSIKYWHTTNILYLLKLNETNRFFACHIILLFCVSYFSFPSFVIFFLFAACKLISIDLDLMWMFQISYTYRLTTKVIQSKRKKKLEKYNDERRIWISNKCLCIDIDLFSIFYVYLKLYTLNTHRNSFWLIWLFDWFTSCE